ncbi:MAG: hypothetical protein ACLUHE_08165 [Christensenellales bacterium]
MAERETPGQRIRNLREAAFITQKDFAERIGVALPNSAASKAVKPKPSAAIF